MDYFSELLDSYDKIKKRTFKLRYISEAEDKKKKEEKKDGKSSQEDIDVASEQEAEKKAKEVAAAGVSQVYDETKRVKDGEPWAYLSPKKGKEPERVSLTLGAGRPMSLADAGGNPDVNSQGWKRLVGYFKLGGGDKAEAENLAAEAAAQAEEERQAALREIGGFLGQEGINNPDAIQAMEGAKNIVDTFCLQNVSTESVKEFCSRSWTYFAAGNGGMGLEYKLGTATSVKVIDEDGTTKEGRASTALVAQAARSAAFLTGFLNSSSEFKCSLVKQRIGMFKGKELVLFGDEPTEGIVIGKPNALHKLALAKIAASKEDGGCGIGTKDLSQLVGNTTDGKAMNAVKGTFYEAIMAFSAKVLIAQKSGLRGVEDARDELLAIIKEKKKILKDIMEKTDLNAGQSIDAAYDFSIQEDLLDDMLDPGTFFDGIMREIRSTQPLIDFMNPDGVISAGKISKTGQRADLVFTYTDPKVARAKAKAIGSSVGKQQPDGTYPVPIGLKRLEKLKATKFGEINNQTRMTKLLTGELIADPNIEPGFAQSMQTRQYGGAGTDREERQQDYARDLEAEITTATSQLLEDKTYIDNEGKIKSQTPEGVLTQLADKVTSMLSFEEQSNSILSKAFFDINAEGENVLKTFKGEGENAVANRQEARERVARCARFSMLKNDANGVARSDDDTPEDIAQRQEAARDYMIKSALICGSNIHNLSQVIVGDDGEMLVIKHNELFDKICKAQSDPDSGEPTFEFKPPGGSSVTISVGGLSLSFNQEGTDGAEDKRDTRSKVSISKATLENPVMQGKLPTPQNNSSFEEYVKGHIKLLETFLS